MAGRERGMEIIAKAAEWIIDAVFPKTCLRCGLEGVWVCASCLETSVPYTAQGCLVCKKGSEENICEDCAKTAPVSFLFSAYSYRDPFVKKIVHTLKYEYVIDLGEYMGSLLGEKMKMCEYTQAQDAWCIPIPIHKKRFRERGFNQSELIARAIAKVLSLSCASGALRRVVYTHSQVDLSKDERIQNVTGAFAIHDASSICGRVVYLIDDVYTTGATLFEAARVLRHAGARDVIGVTFAREE